MTDVFRRIEHSQCRQSAMSKPQKDYTIGTLTDFAMVQFAFLCSTANHAALYARAAVLEGCVVSTRTSFQVTYLAYPSSVCASAGGCDPRSGLQGVPGTLRGRPLDSSGTVHLPPRLTCVALAGPRYRNSESHEPRRGHSKGEALPKCGRSLGPVMGIPPVRLAQIRLVEWCFASSHSSSH